MSLENEMPPPMQRNAGLDHAHQPTDPRRARAQRYAAQRRHACVAPNAPPPLISLPLFIPAAPLAQSPSHLHDWLLAGGAIVILAILAMIAYVATLNLRLAKRITADRGSTGAVPRIVRQMNWAAQTFAALAVLVPVIVLIGWTMRSPRLVSLVPGLVGMNPVVACCLIILGISLWTLIRGSPQAQRIVKITALVVALIALVKLTGWIVGRDTLIDQ